MREAGGMMIKEIVNKASNVFELDVISYTPFASSVIFVRTANKGDTKVTFDNLGNIGIEYTSINHITEEYERGKHL